MCKIYMNDRELCHCISVVETKTRRCGKESMERQQMKNEDEDKAALVLVGQLVRDRKERCKAKAKKKKNMPMLQRATTLYSTYLLLLCNDEQSIFHNDNAISVLCLLSLRCDERGPLHFGKVI